MPVGRSLPSLKARINVDLLARTDLSKLDPSIGDLSKIETLIEQFKHVEGGPKLITNILENGMTDSLKGSIGNAKGALAELKIVHHLNAKGERIIELGGMRKINDCNREIDIITLQKYIEVKNICWEKYPFSVQAKHIDRLKNQITQVAKIAKEHNKIYEFRSLTEIPQEWKIWLSKKNIIFFEGL